MIKIRLSSYDKNELESFKKKLETETNIKFSEVKKGNNNKYIKVSYFCYGNLKDTNNT